MRMLSYSIDGVPSFGALNRSGSGVIELGRRLADVSDLSDLIGQGRLDDARRAVEQIESSGDVADHTLTDISFEVTIPRPQKIFCIGVNYGGRNAEYRDGSEAKDKPSVFVRFPSSLTGHLRDLVRPPESDQLDYEGEIVVVIGTAGRRIAAIDARRHIAGLTLGNEGTIRDWVRHAKFNVTQGKNWESSGSLGPWMVSIDEIGAFEHLHLTTHVNGELRQDDTPASMAFPIDQQIAYLSTFCTLEPGDLIFTGTPTGSGAREDPPRFLKPGDIIEVAVPEIGVLRNGVRDEQP
jgi:2-keto-4-pentenoate hydratase/2-oxohepta-3-ene-1,7-dioic acid hydratase in catechol pathway